MKAFTRFAKAMSEELFTMKAEDYPTETLYLIEDHAAEFVPPEYVTAIIDDPAHISAIKERIRVSVLEDVTANPDEYDMCGKDYVYSGSIYDHAALVDSYIEEQFILDHPEYKTVFICDICGSDNVQSKAWVRPNKNNEFVDLMCEDVQDNYCDDCEENVGTTSVEKNVRHSVIGFQVIDEHNLGKLHPAMSNNKSVYSLEQCYEMIGSVYGWQLLAVWTADIENPVLMFEGDLQK